MASKYAQYAQSVVPRPSLAAALTSRQPYTNRRQGYIVRVPSRRGAHKEAINSVFLQTSLPLSWTGSPSALTHLSWHAMPSKTSVQRFGCMHAYLECRRKFRVGPSAEISSSMAKCTVVQAMAVVEQKSTEGACQCICRGAILTRLISLVSGLVNRAVMLSPVIATVVARSPSVPSHSSCTSKADPISNPEPFTACSTFELIQP